ncbi:Hsp20/alpha crystallin family protein [Desulfogranum mediterraneum]|uniref:Hsp20/alpha crystallin family protein n=1 Tax=Desulfogranum mediterraneum TaxID=160661 RepID=UPI0004293F27|nr:Hsp20/alpha crystallin family protein [Desulfogranum mediterraneum]
MPLIRFTERPPCRNPWAEFERIRRGMDELTKSCTEKGRFQQRANVFPALNIYEQSDQLVITAELPGISSEELDLSVEGDTLTIQGARAAVKQEGPCAYHRREIESGSFSRAINLPAKIDPHHLSARLVDGILTIILRKAAPATPKKIQILSA